MSHQEEAQSRALILAGYLSTSQISSARVKSVLHTSLFMLCILTFIIRVNGDRLTFAVSLSWPLEGLQFGGHFQP